ncbi:MAG: AAA family ATPase [Acidobacteria bacterium]|nr:AAA family ATPase [Acidobacteriota bacterium]
MKVISFYSFKGGTGRTTTTANVATDLARRNKNVVVIDLDIDGPGLDTVLAVKNEIPIYIQDYLKQPNEANYKMLLYDLKKEKHFRKFPGALYFIGANLDVQSPVDATTDIVDLIIRNLIRTLADKTDPKIDYCIIDSQSGYTDLSATVLDVSDHLFLLSKFSRQHIIGTVLYHRLLNHLKITKNLVLDFDVVISVVPEITKPREEKLRAEYLTFIKKNTKQEILVEIPDASSLKWREEVIIGKSTPNVRQVTQAFRAISERCLKL